MKNVPTTVAPEPHEKSLVRFFVIGSSSTLFLHPHLQRMLQGVCVYSRKGDASGALAEASRDLDIPKGASAGDSGMVLQYLQDEGEVEAFNPDIALLSVGFHDIKHSVETGRNRVELDTFRSHVAKIVTWFEQREIQLIWMRAGPLDESVHNAKMTAFKRYEADLKAYNEAAEAILTGRNVRILDMPAFTNALGSMPQLLKDHVHFHESVVEAQASYVAGYISAMVDERRRENVS